MTDLLVGFTGTRGGMTEAQRQAFRRWAESKKERIVFHHGDCVGADDDAATELMLLTINSKLVAEPWVIVHPPEDASRQAFNDFCHEMRQPLPYLDRNKKIVDETTILVACPSGPEEIRSGTWATIRYAKSIGRPIGIIWPDGKMERHS